MEPNTNESSGGGGIIEPAAKGEGDKAGAGGGAGVQAPGKNADGSDQTPEQKAAAEKTAAETAKAAAAGIELKLPEGFKADEAQLGDFKKLAKDIGLDSPRAQKLFDWETQRQATAAKAEQTAIDQLQKKWLDEVKADKDLGGANFPKTKVEIAKALTRMDPKGEFHKLLKDAGLDSHPAAVRFVAGWGAALGEDKLGKGAGDSDSAAAPTKEQVLRERYPNSYDLMNGGKPA